MFEMSDLASIELISGFMVPGACVMASTSSSLAAAGKARPRQAKRTTRRRRSIGAPSHVLALRNKHRHPVAMLQDRYGNQLTTNSAAAPDPYVAAVDQLRSGGHPV